MSPSRGRRPGERSRGQALAEFALVVPILFLVLGGIIQFGIYFWDQATLNQIVRDTGRYAATVQVCGTAGETDVVNKAVALQTQTPFAGSFGTVTVTLPSSGSPCPPNDNSQDVWVEISADATVPMFFPLLDGSISSTATYRMEPVAP